MSKNLIKINKWLYPASWIYGAGVWLRNKLFDWGYYKERTFPLPVICIGNLTVGGTGKTPHTVKRGHDCFFEKHFFWICLDLQR